MLIFVNKLNLLFDKTAESRTDMEFSIILLQAYISIVPASVYCWDLAYYSMVIHVINAVNYEEMLINATQNTFSV